MPPRSEHVVPASGPERGLPRACTGTTCRARPLNDVSRGPRTRLQFHSRHRNRFPPPANSERFTTGPWNLHARTTTCGRVVGDEALRVTSVRGLRDRGGGVSGGTDVTRVPRTDFSVNFTATSTFTGLKNSGPELLERVAQAEGRYPGQGRFATQFALERRGVVAHAAMQTEGQVGADLVPLDAQLCGQV
jgi:hypothetical protein